MSTIALSGRRAETADWARSVLSAVGLPLNALLLYRHWTSGDDANVEVEARRLGRLRPDLLIAKSFGTSVGATAYCEDEFRPQRAVLIGIPFLPMTDLELDRMRRFARGQPTLFIQQLDDPGGAASALPRVLSVEKSNLRCVPGSDHLYNDISSLAQIIRAWPNFSEAGAGRV